MAQVRIVRAGTAVAAVAALAAMAGCGSEESAPGASNGETTGAITVLHYYDEGAGALKDLVPEWEKRFESANEDVDVKFEYVPFDQMQQKVISAAAAGKGWDVIMPTGVSLPEMIKSGAVQPIDAYWDEFQDADQFPENTQGAGVFEDERYAVQGYTNVEGIFYNKKILDEIGVGVPADLDEMEAAMQKAKDAGYNAFTTAAPPGTGGEFNLVPWLASNGWSYEEADAAGGLEILQRLEGWRDQGYFSANDASGFNAEKNFTTGKYAFAQGGNWNLGTFEEDLKFPWGAAVVEGIDGALLGGEIIALGANSENPDLAWKFVSETLMSPEGAKDFATAGSIPLRADAQEIPEVTKNENLKAFATIAANSIANPVNENTAKISEVIGGAYNEFVAGRISADEAAQRIADGVPPLMQ
jgi:ABC-type glycerol-3-phosphate transport system substrate-binding protein